MRLIICLDNNMGYSFCGKRQSRDETVHRKILELIKGHKLYMNEYSASLFLSKRSPSAASLIEIRQRPEIRAKGADWRFVENTPVDCEPDEMVLFFWNRDYPSSLRFVPDMSKYTLVQETEFKGKSHEKITQKRYVKETL